MQRILIKYSLKQLSVLIFFLILITVSCKKEKSETSPLITDIHLLKHMDSLLTIAGISYSNLFSGNAIQGGFIFNSYYSSYNANCPSVSMPFRINTVLDGNVSLDSNNMFTLINAGDLFVNNYKISPLLNSEDDYHYTVGSLSPESAALDDLIYGKSVQFMLKEADQVVLDNTVYVPKNIILSGINCTTGRYDNNIINGGYTITWNGDSKNKLGVIIELDGITNEGIEKKTYLLVADYGRFTFGNEHLSNYSKDRNSFGLDVSLIRGAFILTKGLDNRMYKIVVINSCSYLFELP